MGKNIDNYKNQSIDKIRIGSCIELYLLLDSFDSCFERLQTFIDNNSFLFSNQSKCTVSSEFKHICEVLTFCIDSLLDDISKEGIYMEYLLSSY